MERLKELATWWGGSLYHKPQLDAMVNSTDIQNFAYILHDKDINPDTGELKKPHYHFLVKFGRNLRGSWFKRFWSDEFGKIMPDPVRVPLGAYNYLIHDTPTARKQGKHLYDPSERISTFEDSDFETADEKEKSEKLSSQQVRNLILKDGKKPCELLLGFNLSKQQKELADMLYVEFMCKDISINKRELKNIVYLYGKPRTGKTSYIYDKHSPAEFYRVSNYKNPFDNYGYQKILVLDEYDSQLDIEFANNLLDRFPCELPCRFYNKWAGWDTVYIISNISIDEQYTDQHADKRLAFKERFKEIIHFPLIPPPKKQTIQQLTALPDSVMNELGF